MLLSAGKIAKRLCILFALLHTAACSDLSVFVGNQGKQFEGQFSVSVDDQGKVKFKTYSPYRLNTNDFQLRLRELPVTDSSIALTLSSSDGLLLSALDKIPTSDSDNLEDQVFFFSGSSFSIPYNLKQGVTYQAAMIPMGVDLPKSWPVTKFSIRFPPPSTPGTMSYATGLLNWEKISGALGYRIYADAEMKEPLGESSSNSFKVDTLHSTYWIVPVRGELSGEEPIALNIPESKTFVKEMNSSITSGFISTDAEIIFETKFSSKVHSFGSPALYLQLDNTIVRAELIAGNGSDTLKFLYKIKAGDNSQNLQLANRPLAGLIDETNAIVVSVFDKERLKLNQALSIIVDSQRPVAPLSIGFNQATSNNGLARVAWGNGFDLNFSSYEVRLCPNNACSGSCLASSESGINQIDYMNLSDGSYFACVRSQDKAGLKSDWTASLYPLLVDKLPPVISAGPDVHSSIMQDTQATSSGANFYSWTQVSGPGAITFGSANDLQTSLSATVEGEYTLRLQASDAAGNTSSDDMKFTWDLTAPTFAGVGDVNRRQQSSSAWIFWDQATDNLTDAADIRYELCYSETPGSCLNNFVVNEVMPANRWSFKVSGLNPASEYEFRMRARDRAGNTDTNTAITGSAFVSHAKAVDLGRNSQCFIASDDKLYCWGQNTHNQISPSATASYSTPTEIVGLSGVKRFYLGKNSQGEYQCVILIDGNVKCWGENADGQVGVGSKAHISTPTVIPELFGAKSLSLGANAACAVMGDDTAKCWGDNLVGKLGDGTNIERLTPTPVLNLSNVASIVIDVNKACAVLIDGTASCWGFSPVGPATATPTPIVGVNNALQISLGDYHLCILSSDGAVKCAGSNTLHVLGNEAYASSLVPIPAVGVTNAIAIQSTEYQTCALLSDGGIQCWGWLDSTFYRGVSAHYEPFRIPGISGITQFSMAGEKICGLISDGKIQCWGILGDMQAFGLNATKKSPVFVQQLNDFEQADRNASSHSCYVKSDGSIWCWGDNSRGQLGDGTLITRDSPVRVNGLGLSKMVSTGFRFSCALLMDDSVSCWGSGSYGQLGNGLGIDSLTPVAVDGLTSVKHLASSEYSTCATLNDGTVKCWGQGFTNFFADNHVQGQSLSPISIAGISNAVSVTIGYGSACALLNDASLRCWGENSYGEMGIGTTSPFENVTAPLVSDVKSVSIGFRQTCVVLNAVSGNSVKCWGLSFAALGDGDSIAVSSPTFIPNTAGAKAVTTGLLQSCALYNDGSLSCWGSTSFDATLTNHKIIGIKNVAWIDSSHLEIGLCLYFLDQSFQCNGGFELGGIAKDRGEAYLSANELYLVKMK
jgi:alpha-tubulin suppressor-like RCC1 family protein